jgi:hypothetical protein
MVEQKAQNRRKVVTIPQTITKHLKEIIGSHRSGKNKYGHFINKPGGFIDQMLEQQKSVDEIVKAWAKEYPDEKPITAARVVDEAKHLLAEHNFNVQVDKGQQVKPKKG